MADLVKSPDTSPVASARVQRSRAEHRRVRAAFDAWLAYRRAEDSRQTYQQYATQLGALKNAIDSAFLRIDADLASLGAVSAPAPARVFALCAQHDVRLAWIQRLWFYFRHKFDQRDDPAIAPLLKAADEIVWSCYKPAFEQSGAILSAAPLPYLEPLYSPHAVLRVEPPRELLWNADDPFAASCLATLPIPVIGVPASAVGAPWLLGLLAHEVGHHVQADLDGGSGQGIRAFAEVLKDAASATPKPELWLARGREVFADAFSVLAIGAATLPLLAELLLGDETSMLASFDTRYPAPYVRLTLLRALIQALGLPAAADPHGLDLILSGAVEILPPVAQLAVAELPHAPKIVAAALAWKDSRGLTFPQLLGWSETDTAPPHRHFSSLDANGDLLAWTQSFAAGSTPAAPSQLESPRLLVGAGVLAWSQLISQEDPAEREDTLAQLAVALVSTVPTCREQKTRASAEPSGCNGAALADRLMNATEAELGARSPLSSPADPPQ